MHPDFGSFPSGHSSNAALVATALGIIFMRTWVWVAGAVYTVLMMLSRTYLGAHWISDTIGGMLVGAGVAVIVWAPFANKLYREHRMPHPPIWVRVHSPSEDARGRLIAPGERGAGPYRTGASSGMLFRCSRTARAGERPDRTSADLGEASSRVTTFELFFDLVYVFAFTQVSRLMAETHSAIRHPAGAHRARPDVVDLGRYCWLGEPGAAGSRRHAGRHERRDDRGVRGGARSSPRRTTTCPAAGTARSCSRWRTRSCGSSTWRSTSSRPGTMRRSAGRCS